MGRGSCAGGRVGEGQALALAHPPTRAEPRVLSGATEESSCLGGCQKGRSWRGRIAGCGGARSCESDRTSSLKAPGLVAECGKGASLELRAACNVLLFQKKTRARAASSGLGPLRAAGRGRNCWARGVKAGGCGGEGGVDRAGSLLVPPFLTPRPAWLSFGSRGQELGQGTPNRGAKVTRPRPLSRKPYSTGGSEAEEGTAVHLAPALGSGVFFRKEGVFSREERTAVI